MSSWSQVCQVSTCEWKCRVAKGASSNMDRGMQSLVTYKVHYSHDRLVGMDHALITTTHRIV